MKRIITAGLLSIAIIFTCTLLIVKVNHYEQSMQSMLDDITLMYEQEDYEKAYELALSAEQEWVEAESVLSLFIADKLLATIGEQISTLPAIIATHNDDDFYIQSALIRTQLIHLKKYETLSFHTVL